MLILTRRVDEKIVIGEQVSVTVLSVKGSQVRIGIEAPPEVKIYREEIYQRILKERVETLLSDSLLSADIDNVLSGNI